MGSYPWDTHPMGMVHHTPLIILSGYKGLYNPSNNLYKTLKFEPMGNIIILLAPGPVDPGKKMTGNNLFGCGSMDGWVNQNIKLNTSSIESGYLTSHRNKTLPYFCLKNIFHSITRKTFEFIHFNLTHRCTHSGYLPRYKFWRKTNIKCHLKLNN